MEVIIDYELISLVSQLIYLGLPIIIVAVLFSFSVWFMKTLSASDRVAEKKKISPTELLIENFIKSMVDIKNKIPKNSNLNEFHLPTLLENGKVLFYLSKSPTSVPTILEFPSLKVFTKIKQTTGMVGNVNSHSTLVENTYYHLSVEDFERFCGTKFNDLFKIRMNKLIELCKKEELQQKLEYLIPRFEISFTTILNVINEQSKDSNGKPLPESMADKVYYIIESFEEKIYEAEERRVLLKSLESKGLEKSLEEQLEFEVKVIEKVNI